MAIRIAMFAPVRVLFRLTVAKFYYRLLRKPLAFTNCFRPITKSQWRVGDNLNNQSQPEEPSLLDIFLSFNLNLVLRGI